VPWRIDKVEVKNLAVGVTVAWAFGFDLVECLVIGAVTTFSSTIIGLKLLPTTVLHHQRTGEVVISILLLQDLLAILLLVILTGGAEEQHPLLEMVKLGLDPEQGIDRYFLALARDDKPVLELETVERQLDVLLDVPEPELLVAQTLGQLDELDTIMQRLIDRWKAGDGPALAKLVIEDELAAHPEYATLHKRMFDDRNREMTERIMALQGAGETLFVVVGAGHLVGERGIIALLTRRGYAPRQL